MCSVTMAWEREEILLLIKAYDKHKSLLEMGPGKRNIFWWRIEKYLKDKGVNVSEV